MALRKQEVAAVVALADKNYSAGKRHGLELAIDIVETYAGDDVEVIERIRKAIAQTS